MADNSLPERELSNPETTAQKSDAAVKIDAQRRAFIGRAAIAALPVVLATVRGRTASAWGGTSTPSCPKSANMSSCAGH
jgi:hypothetical protein